MKTMGTPLWIIAFVLYVLGALNNTNAYLTYAYPVIICLHMPFQLYNWTKGMHRGQPEHFILIVAQLLFSIVLLFINRLTAKEACIISLVYLTVSTLAPLNLRRRFPQHFRRKSS